jgi:hypothetical protein
MQLLGTCPSCHPCLIFNRYSHKFVSVTDSIPIINLGKRNTPDILGVTVAVAQHNIRTITGVVRPCGFQEVETPILQDSYHMKVVRLSALRTGGYGTIDLQDVTQQNQRFSTYRNSFVLDGNVSYHNTNFTLLFHSSSFIIGHL